MIQKVIEIPEKNTFRRRASRMNEVEDFLKSGFDCAEYTPEGADNPRRAYNGLLMAIRRAYPGKAAVLWRRGRVYLKRMNTAAEEK
ncbi:MAG: hypothetical protein IJC48_01185 [Clostridia bacterium]|nr:hypothetical protein [Clostridia bacterium]